MIINVKGKEYDVNEKMLDKVGMIALVNIEQQPVENQADSLTSFAERFFVDWKSLRWEIDGTEMLTLLNAITDAINEKKTTSQYTSQDSAVTQSTSQPMPESTDAPSSANGFAPKQNTEYAPSMVNGNLQSGATA